MPAPAKVRVEIFPGPTFFDDNWVKDWSVSGYGSFASDGDIVTITVDATQGYGSIQKSASFNTNPHRYAIIRCTELLGNHWVAQFMEGVTIHVTKVYYDAGIKEIDLYTEKGAHFNCDKIVLSVYKDTDGNTGKFDYVAVCKDVLLIPTETDDLIDELIITQPLLAQGIADAKMKFLNPNGAYTGKVTEFDIALIYLWRDGATMKKVFGGRIVKPGYEGDISANEFYLTATLEDHGHELLSPPSLLQKVYESVNGKTIIEESVDLCNYVTKKFVDVDSEIASTHSFEFDEVKPQSVINDVCAQAKTLGGVVGFDAYVDPAGNMNVFKRGKYTSGVDLTNKILLYNKNEDVHRVRNKIKVYGAREKAYPANKYAWTESTTPSDGAWTSGTGTGSVSADTTKKLVGTASIKLNVTGSDYYGRVIFTLNSGKEASCYHDHEFQGLSFHITMDDAYRGFLIVVIEDDTGTTRRRYISIGKKSEWTLVNIPCGRKNEGEWTTPVGEGAFNWKKVKKIDITCEFPTTGTGAFWIDMTHFNKARFVGTKEDSSSQSKYKVRCEEPIIDDSLKSDNECLKKAESLCDFLKDKVTTLENFMVEGNNNFKPGYRQLIQITNDNINDYFRILKIRHVVHNIVWDTYLTLSNEPTMMDYIFADLHREVRRLSLSKGKGNPGGGCAGERYMAATKVVAPEGYTAEQFDHTTIQAAINAIAEGETGALSPLYAIEKFDYYGLYDALIGREYVPRGTGFPYKFPFPLEG